MLDQAAPPLRWLHLSDLHFVAGDGYAHGVVLEALVTAFKKGGTLADRRPQLIFCTGDIAQGGKEKEYEAAARFFGELLEATGVPPEAVFLVPGNHDVDRARVSKRMPLQLGDVEEANGFFGPDGAEEREIVFRRFAAYAAFQHAQTRVAVDAEKPYLLAHHQAGAERLAIVGLNSAWLADRDEVQGKLVVGERLVRDALKELDRGAPTVKIAMLHHPLDWLADFESTVVKSLLVEGVDFILHGHLHSQRPEVLEGAEGRVVVFAAGAAYQGQRSPNTALLVELHGGEARAEAITYRAEYGGGVWMRDPILNPYDSDDRGIFRVPRRAVVEPVTRPAAIAEKPLLAGPQLDRYLRDVEANHGTVLLAGLIGDRPPPAIPIEEIYVSLDATRPDLDVAATSREPREHDAFSAVKRALANARRRGKQAELDDTTRPLLAAALRAVGLPPAEAERPETLASTWSRVIAAGDRDLAEVLRRQPIEDALRVSPHLLIEGAPGSGKTTVLKHVTMALVSAQRGQTARAEAMGFTAPFPVPLVVLLRRFARWLADQPEAWRLNGGAEVLVAYLAEVAGACSGGGAWVQPALEAGAAAVLLDGLDEITDAHLRDRCANIVRDFLLLHPQCRFVLTSRPTGLSALAKRVLLDLGHLGHTAVRPLDDAQLDGFVAAWYKALLAGKTAEAERRAKDLVERIRRAPHLGELARTPILLTAIAVVHQSSGQLPERRAELYERCVQSLAHLWHAAKEAEDGPGAGRGELSHDQKVDLLQAAAYRIQASGQQTLGLGALIELVREKCPGANGARRGAEECRALVDRTAERSGLLVPDQDGEYAFRHLQFKEFLAARWICTEGINRVELLAERLGDAAWREVVILAPAIKWMWDKPEAISLLEGLAQRATMLPGDDARVTALGWVSRAALDLREYQAAGLARVVERMAAEAERLLEDKRQPGAESDRVTLAGALSLGNGGDPRLREERRWVEVPAGPFWRGAAQGDRDAGPFEKPAGLVDVWEFRIQRWPVTVGEYLRFVDAKGYDVGMLVWSKGGIRWRATERISAPGRWEKQLKGPHNAPVVEVSWWEAEAYCAWLTSLRKAGDETVMGANPGLSASWSHKISENSRTLRERGAVLRAQFCRLITPRHHNRAVSLGQRRDLPGDFRRIWGFAPNGDPPAHGGGVGEGGARGTVS
jgi:predicted MPP superfamily phosphohydrolase